MCGIPGEIMMQITLLKLIDYVTNVISVIIMEQIGWLLHVAEYLGSSDSSLENIHRAQTNTLKNKPAV